MTHTLFMPKELFGLYKSSFIGEFSQKYKIDPHYSDKCLCEIEPHEITSDFTLFHPHPNDQMCHQKISEIIKKNPFSNFYVFAMGASGKDRLRLLGKHDNLYAIKNNADLDKVAENLKEAKETVLA